MEVWEEVPKAMDHSDSPHPGATSVAASPPQSPFIAPRGVSGGHLPVAPL